ncbi:MAG: hypothetical protein P4M05_28300 [Bradyrhizobium sp.]|nr:hypothetical protein [Bradyrhizobium sp.]
MTETENKRSREGQRMRTFEQIEAAIRNSAGVFAVAAQALNVHRQRIYEWVEADPRLQAVCSEVLEETLDLAEGKLLQAIKDGSEKSIHFYLDRRGRERGYGNRMALAGSPGEPPIGVAVLPDLTGISQSDRDELRAILERAAGKPRSGASGT